MTFATLYLYYMIVVELSLWADFCLFDQRNTSAAHQQTSDLNKQQTPISSSSRVGHGRANFNEIYNVI